jgi:two-component system, OmpR family, sensor histidine kinase KdpD
MTDVGVRRLWSDFTRQIRESEATGDVPPPRPPRLLGLVGWSAALLVIAGGMLQVRSRLNEAHVALVFLLVVLGSSAYAGRTFGLAVAGSAFLLFDWFFLPPYGALTVANPLDWLVLLAFFGTSVVAAQLLYRARAQARSAQARAVEIDRLAVLGAETLNAGPAGETLPAIANVIRTTLDVAWCEVYMRDSETGAIVRGVRSPGDDSAERVAAVAEGKLVQWVAAHGGEAVEFEDGTSRVRGAVDADVALATPSVAVAGADGSEELPLRALYLPLRVRDRVVGVLGIGSGAGFRLGASRRRVLRALSYYAALGVERVRLVRAVEHAEALRAANRLKDAVLASVSHDLRTPLTTIKALANEMAVAGDDRAVVIEQEADRLNGFVENLLDLSHIQAGGARRPPIPNEAEDLVGAALQRVGGRAASRELRAIIEPDNDVLLVGRFDFTDTLHALVNLLENAIKYSPAPAPIELVVRRDGPWLCFAVADRGPGVPPSERERIFEPFYRPNTAPSDAGGAGLGLSIARSLAVAQGGSVTFDERAGGGSVFTLRVPAVDLSQLAAPALEE